MLALSPSLRFIADSATDKNRAVAERRVGENWDCNGVRRCPHSSHNGFDEALHEGGVARPPIKAAFISSNFYDHSIGLILIEMILYLHKDYHSSLDVYVYFIDKRIPINTPVFINGSTVTLHPITQAPAGHHHHWRHDRITAAFEEHLGIRFIRVPDNIYTIRAVLGAADLDFLLFSDLGMDFSTYQVAFSRLAPYQVCTDAPTVLMLMLMLMLMCKDVCSCMTSDPIQAVWCGHPITSSLDSIDYFISIDDEVPEAALEHYSEQLVRMDHINVVPLQTVGLDR